MALAGPTISKANRKPSRQALAFGMASTNTITSLLSNVVSVSVTADDQRPLDQPQQHGYSDGAPDKLTPTSCFQVFVSQKCPLLQILEVLLMIFALLQILYPHLCRMVPETDDKIWAVMNSDNGEMPHETFNKRFDAMFSEDCHAMTYMAACTMSAMERLEWV